MKILITGVSGFIGSKLLTAVCNRFGTENVLALSSKVNNQCSTITYDSKFVINPSEIYKLENIELIIHAGAFTPKSRIEVNDIIKCNGNILFTSMLLEANKFTNLKKILFTSTLDVYADDKIISETTPLNPVSLYGVSKLYCEKMISSFCEEFGLIGQILRIGHVYGPGEEKYQKLLPIAIRNMLNDSEIELWGDGSEVRSFIYIDDVIEACMASIELDEDVGVINIVGEQSTTISGLLAQLSKIESKKLKITHKEYTGIKKDLLFDSTKMKKYLLDVEIPFSEGLKQEIEYFKRTK